MTGNQVRLSFINFVLTIYIILQWNNNMTLLCMVSDTIYICVAMLNFCKKLDDKTLKYYTLAMINMRIIIILWLNSENLDYHPDL